MSPAAKRSSLTRSRERAIGIVCPEYKPYEKKIAILGGPNQVLNVVLQKQ